MRSLSVRVGPVLCFVIGLNAIGPVSAQAQDMQAERPASTGEAAYDSTLISPDQNSHPWLGDELLRLSDRIGALERLVAQLVARQDENQRSAAVSAAEFSRFRADAEARIEAIEQQASSPVPTSRLVEPELGPAVQEQEVAPVLPDRFEQGMDFVRKQQWSEAELALDTFISNNPDDGRIAEARYQLGLAYLGQQQAAQAARIFLDLFETGDAEAFGADNLFALAVALEQIDPGNTEQVCTVFSEIEASYGASLTPMQREKLLDQRLVVGCPG